MRKKIVHHLDKIQSAVVIFGIVLCIGTLISMAKPKQQEAQVAKNTASVKNAEPEQVDVSEKQKIAITKTEIVTTEEEVPFSTTQTYDGTLPKDTTVVRVEGHNGKKVVKTEVKTKDGVEVSRELISEDITVPAVAKVVALGTKVMPNKQKLDETSCNTHYAPCVPVSRRDLDCKDIGHRVAIITIGSDPYNLDSDDDGIGCEMYAQ